MRTLAYGLRRGGYPGRSSRAESIRRTAWRATSAVAVAGLAVQALVLAAPAASAASGGGAAGFAHTPSTPVTAVTSHYAKPVPETSWKPPAAAWPAGTADVTLAGTTGAQAVGSLPLTLASAPATGPSGGAAKAPAGGTGAASAPAKATVTVETQAASAALGVKGVVVSVGRADGVPSPGQVDVSLSYASFADAFGGDYGPRLGLVAFPACALTTPSLAACRVETPVKFTNNGPAKTLSAAVTVPAAAAAATKSSAAGTSAGTVTTPSALVLAVMPMTDSSSGSGGGDYTATSLKPSGSWSAGGSADAFTWSYPLTVPSTPGGLEPQLGLTYDSQSLDGLTSSTNDQAGVVGDGWNLSQSFVERSYTSCHQNPAGATRPTTTAGRVTIN